MPEEPPTEQPTSTDPSTSLPPPPPPVPILYNPPQSPTSPEPSHNEETDAALALAMHTAEMAALQDAHGPNIGPIIIDATYGRLVPHINAHSYYYSPQEQARQRLESRLRMYALQERFVPGDGNCQFASLSDQLYNTYTLHNIVREKVVWQLQNNPERYNSYVPGNYKKYCKSMSKMGTWGDHVTLQAAADFFRLKICLLTSFEETTIIEVDPVEGAPGCRTLWLAFWAEIHYNSIMPAGEAPPPVPALLMEQKKLLGSIKLHQWLFG